MKALSFQIRDFWLPHQGFQFPSRGFSFPNHSFLVSESGFVVNDSGWFPNQGSFVAETRRDRFSARPPSWAKHNKNTRRNSHSSLTLPHSPQALKSQ